MVAARYNPHLNSFRDKLVAAGKSKLVALIAFARKLTTILDASFEIDAHGSQSPLEQQGSRSVITHRHFRRAYRDEAPDFRAPLPGSPISESMSAWIALICSG